MQTQKINWTFRKIKGSLTTWSHQILEFNHLNPWGFPLKKPTHPKKPQWFFPPEGPTCTKTCVQTRLVPRDRVHEPACKWTSMNSYCLFLWLYMSWQKNKWTHQVQRYNYAVNIHTSILPSGGFIYFYIHYQSHLVPEANKFIHETHLLKNKQKLSVEDGLLSSPPPHVYF